MDPRGTAVPPTAMIDGDGCLDDEVLVAMADGALGSERIDTVLTHIDRCERCAEVIASIGALDGPARRVGRYQIERVLGVGGMGIVYAAFDPRLQRRVAVKLVRPENTHERAQALIIAEARTIARISHPNVVAVHDAGEHGGEIYLATELVDGTTLTQWQADHASTQEIVGVWIQAARGLAAAHAMGVVHRDVKPDNVLVGHDGRVRIGDFGIAHHGAPPPGEDTAAGSSDATAQADSLIAGTPAYMAPEHRAGRVDARSDQYSACVAIVEALTGRRPQADEVVSIEPRALAAVLTRGLRADPTERLSTMDELADALASAIAPPPARRRRMEVAVAVSAAALIAGSLAAAPGSSTGECAVATVPDTVWSARRDTLARRLPADIGPYVNYWLAGWANASGNVCTTRDPVIRARRQTCLRATLRRLDRLLAGWESSPPRDALTAFNRLAELPRPAWCSEAAMSQTPDRTPQQLEAGATIEGELAAASTVAALERLLERARAIGDASLVTKVSVALAAGQAETDRAGAIRTLRAAIAGARGFPAVTAAVQLIGMLGADALGEAEALAASARAQLAGVGGDPALEADIDLRLGILLNAAGRRHDAIAALERARQTARMAHGPASPQEGEVLDSLAGALFVRDGATTSPAARAAGKAADEIWKRTNIPFPGAIPAETAGELLEQVERLRALTLAQYGPDSEAAFDAEYASMDAYVVVEQPERALEHARKVVELGRRLGLRTARLAYALSQSAYLASDLGRHREALSFARDAVAAATEVDVNVELASALTALGRASIETGNPEAAREPLQRALAIRVRLNEPGRFRGVTRSWLAVALWESNRARALEQAMIARDEIQSFLDNSGIEPDNNPLTVGYMRRYLQANLDRLDRWMRQHRR